MSRSSYGILGFNEAHHETHLDWSARTIAAWPWPVLTALRTLWEALHEGLAAHRRYERLRSRGVPHGPAISASLGMPPQSTRQAAKPLCFAGKA
jgi:hypothetical protein